MNGRIGAVALEKEGADINLWHTIFRSYPDLLPTTKYR